MATYIAVPPTEGTFPRDDSAEFPRARGDAIDVKLLLLLGPTLLR